MAKKRRRVHPLAAAATMAPLAIALLAPKTASAPHPTDAAEKVKHKNVCALTLKACPDTGCAPTDKPEDALLNQTKRHLSTTSHAKTLSWDDFVTLQEDADSTVGQHNDLDAKDRAKLRNISVSSGKVSEGDLVQLDGFLVGNPHPNSSGESVNCNLSGSDNNDFHIPFADDPDKSPFQGIVVEMIPQDRNESHPEWTTKTLNKIKKARRMVRFSGQLLYDNMHLVNSDEDNSIGNQPPRFSLFEIHPVTDVSVCKQAETQCAAGDWESLEDFLKEKAHP